METFFDIVLGTFSTKQKNTFSNWWKRIVTLDLFNQIIIAIFYRMHRILCQRKRETEGKTFLCLIWSFFVFYSSGIFHFVKDNYFRTLSSSSDDEYDSDDSVDHNDHPLNTNTANATTVKPSNPTGILVNTTASTAAGPALTTTASLHTSAGEHQKWETRWFGEIKIKLIISSRHTLRNQR